MRQLLKTRKMLLVLLFTWVLSSIGPALAAPSKTSALLPFTNNDLRSVYRGQYYRDDGRYRSFAPECAQGTSAAISGNIPEPHKTILQRVADDFEISPNLLAALFLTEQGNIWKPLDTQWASSNKGANGPFQFLKTTWTGFGFDLKDIQDFEISARAAATFAQTEGVTASTPLGDIEHPFRPNTFLTFAMGYNWGPGRVKAISRTDPNAPISRAPDETEEYAKNVYALVSSGFTKGGHKNYPDPTIPGQTNPGTVIAVNLPNDAANGVTIQQGCTTTPNTIADIAEREYQSGGQEFTTGVGEGNKNAPALVSWALKEVGTPLKDGDGDTEWLYTSVSALVAYAKAADDFEYFGASDSFAPQRNDIAVYLSDGFEHIDIVSASSSQSQVMIVVGSDQEGTMTRRQISYLPGENGLVGFIRPPAPIEAGITPPPNIPGGCQHPDGYINPKVGECVGVESSVQLTPYDTSTNPSRDVVIRGTVEGKIIYGCVDLEGDGAVLKNNKIICYKSRDLVNTDFCPDDYSNCPGFEAAVSSNGTNALIEHNEILCHNAQGVVVKDVAPCDVGIKGGNFTARFNNIYHIVDGFYPNSNSKIEYNYIHDQIIALEEWIPRANSINGPGGNRYSHADGIQTGSTGKENLSIIGNFLQGVHHDVQGAQAMLLFTGPSSTPTVVRNNRVYGEFNSLRISCINAFCQIERNVIDIRYKSAGKAIELRGNPRSYARCNSFSDGSLVETLHMGGGGIANNGGCGAPVQ